MGKNTKIEWASLGLNRSASFNPLRAFRKDDGKRGWMCVHKNSACKFCYAERMNMNRYYGNGLSYAVGNLSKVDLQLIDVTAPMRWKAPRGIFWCSMTDWMGEFVLDEYIDAMLSTALNAKQHRHAFLTKRPERMLEYFSGNWRERIMFDIAGEFPNHVWLGVSIHDQQCAYEFMTYLVELRELLGENAIIWLSIEPLLDEIDLSKWIGEYDCMNCGYRGNETRNDCEACGDMACPNCGSSESFGFTESNPYFKRPFDWVVVGGESGINARPMNLTWARLLRDQCQTASIPFFFKQWGEWRTVPREILNAKAITEAKNIMLWDDDYAAVYVGKKKAGRLLDGREWNEYPVKIDEN